MTALALMRLLPENGRVVAGHIEVGGTDTLALPEAGMRSVRGGRIGMIFQEPSTSLNPVMKVGDQIVEAIEAHTELRGAAARAKAIEWLRRVGIPEPERRIDEYPFRMSGGQKQRVMIAIALAAEPDFLIADEPTTALDVTIQAQILDLLKQLQKEQGMGLLLITHDLGVVAGMAQRVALMYAGQIIEVAEADDFFRAPKHPYARALLRALPDARRRGEPLAAIAGTVPALSQRFDGCRFAPRCTSALPRCATTPPELLPRRGRPQRALRALRAGSALPSRPQRPVQADPAAGPRRSCAGRAAARRPGPVGPLSDPQGGAAARGRPLHGRGRRVLQGGRRPHAGARGRVGLRQDDDRQGHRAAAASPGRHHRRGRARRAEPVRARRRGAACRAPQDPDHLPGSRSRR